MGFIYKADNTSNFGFGTEDLEADWIHAGCLLCFWKCIHWNICNKKWVLILAKWHV